MVSLMPSHAAITFGSVSHLLFLSIVYQETACSIMRAIPLLQLIIWNLDEVMTRRAIFELQDLLLDPVMPDLRQQIDPSVVVDCAGHETIAAWSA